MKSDVLNEVVLAIIRFSLIGFLAGYSTRPAPRHAIRPMQTAPIQIVGQRVHWFVIRHSRSILEPDAGPSLRSG